MRLKIFLIVHKKHLVFFGYSVDYELVTNLCRS